MISFAIKDILLYNISMLSKRYYPKRKSYRGNEQRRRQLTRRLLLIFLIIFALIICGIVVIHLTSSRSASANAEDSSSLYEADISGLTIEEWPDLDVQLLDVNPYSRPGTAIDEVAGIVIHYTANPGTTAQQNRDYFNNLATTGETYASSHFVIGLEGEIIQCIPCSEIAYASNDRNHDTLAIECCIEDDTGEFNSATYASLVELTAWLVGRYDLSISDVIRHYDVTGKNCPKYYVEHEDAWEQFKADVVDYLLENGTEMS